MGRVAFLSVPANSTGAPYPSCVVEDIGRSKRHPDHVDGVRSAQVGKYLVRGRRYDVYAYQVGKAICPLAALGLYRWGHTGLAVFALLWPLALHVVKYLVWMLMAILLAAPLGIELMQVGVIQRRFMLQLGYTRNEDECVRSFG